MNGYELICLALASLILLAYLYHTFRSIPAALSLTGAALLPLYLAIEKVSQFLTYDELYLLLEPLTLSDLTQWSYRSLRTSDAVFGALGVLARHLLSPSPTQALALAKV